MAFAVAEALVEQALAGRWSRRELEESVSRTAGPGALDHVGLVACRIALRDPRILSLSPAFGAETVLRLIVALRPMRELSLWTGSGARAVCAVALGRAVPTASARDFASTVISGRTPRTSAQTRGAAVSCWGSVRGAVVARGPKLDGGDDELLRHAAAALGLLLEKQFLLERGAARERELVEASERRLIRLGLDLHDGPIQDLAGIGTMLHLAVRRLQRRRTLRGLEANVKVLEETLSQLLNAYENIRGLAQSAAGSYLAASRIEDFIRREAEMLSARAGVDVDVRVDGTFDDLTASQCIAFGRILQEALSNACEHSGARRVRVSLGRRGSSISLEVRDDGGGFDVDRAVAGAARNGRLGLVGMSERARLLGGILDIESEPGKGTRISATLPEWRPIETPDLERPAAGTFAALGR